MRPAPASRPAREAFLVAGAVVLLLALLYRLGVPRFPDVVAAVFLFVPIGIASWRREPLEAYGLTWAPLGRSLAVAAVAVAITLPVFALALHFYYRAMCGPELAGLAHRLGYGALCSHWRGLGAGLALPPDFAGLAIGQVAGVALPEELFYRGYLQRRLEAAYPARRRLWGTPVGKALLAGAAVFALSHVLIDFDVRRLAVFFPALAFGWMRARTGSILAGTLYHAACNVMSDVLHASAFR